MLLSGPRKEGDSGLMATDSVRDGDNNNNMAPLDGGTDCVCVRVCVSVCAFGTAAKTRRMFSVKSSGVTS